MKKPADITGVRNITVSGRIGTGKTTLANSLGEFLGWEVLDGGKIFRKLFKDLGVSIMDKQKIPDEIDREFEEKTRQMLINGKNQIIQSHLAGFVAQGIDGVYKILVVCQNLEGEDKASIRIDRLMNRDKAGAEEARKEVLEREENNLEKFRKLYINNDKSWVYWDEKYYDLVVNTYSLGQKEALDFVLKHLKIE